MGSSNREYMQADYEDRGPAWGHDIPTTKWLLIITAVVFILQTLTLHDIDPRGPKGPPVVAKRDFNHTIIEQASYRLAAFMGNAPQASYIEEWFELEADKVLSGQVWRLFTYIFCHSRVAIIGLLFNLLALYYLGGSLERMYGSREILWFYLGSGLVCGLIFTAFGLRFNLPYPLMGAGPGVISLLTLYATHFPRREIYFFGLFPVEVRFVVVAYVIIDLYTILQAYTGQAPWVTVAYTSELWGIVYGYLYRRMDWHLQGVVEYFDLSRTFRAYRRSRASRNLKVYQPEPAVNLDEQVDAILAKIHEQGSESLTERERLILQKASEQAKNRH